MCSSAGEGEVVGPVGLAGDELGVLLAERGGADAAHVGRAVVDDGHAGTPCSTVDPWRICTAAAADRLHDVLVAGAAAEVALEPVADLVLGGVRVLAQQVEAGHDHARGAVAALQPVGLVERLLQRVQRCALPGVGQALDRADLSRRRPGRRASVQDFTDWPSTWTVQAPQFEVSHPTCVPAEPERLAQVVHEQRARLDLVGVGRPVDGHGDPGHASPMGSEWERGATASRNGPMASPPPARGHYTTSPGGALVAPDANDPPLRQRGIVDRSGGPVRATGQLGEETSVVSSSTEVMSTPRRARSMSRSSKTSFISPR